MLIPVRHLLGLNITVSLLISSVSLRPSADGSVSTLVAQASLSVPHSNVAVTDIAHTLDVSCRSHVEENTRPSAQVRRRSQLSTGSNSAHNHYARSTDWLLVALGNRSGSPDREPQHTAEPSGLPHLFVPKRWVSVGWVQNYPRKKLQNQTFPQVREL